MGIVKKCQGQLAVIDKDGEPRSSRWSSVAGSGSHLERVVGSFFDFVRVLVAGSKTDSGFGFLLCIRLLAKLLYSV